VLMKKHGYFFRKGVCIKKGNVWKKHNNNFGGG